MDRAPDVTALLTSITDRLNAIVPPEFHLAVDGEMIWFGGSGSYAGQAYALYLDNLADESWSPREDRDPRYEPTTLDEVIAAVAFKVMDELQDEIDREAREPWPGRRAVPKAHAVVEDDALHMWFGDRAAPAAACGPLALEDLT